MFSVNSIGFLSVVIAVTYCPLATSRAYHKVHNLALYPERHSWCQVTPIQQEISSSAECQGATIDNNVCLGACFSYSVPKAQDDPVIPPYCDACRPTFSAWKVVALNCTNPTTGEPYVSVRNVEIISNCSCVDCSDNQPRQDQPQAASESPEAESSAETPDEVPNEVDDEKIEDEDDFPLEIPTLRKLKSVSAEAEANKAYESAKVGQIMLQNNKIPDDDDDLEIENDSTI